MTNEEKLKWLNPHHIKRYWNKINVTEDENECWDWVANMDKDGYGLLAFHLFNLRAHRVSLYLAGKGAGNNLVAMHTCDRPCCCNPNHLKWGTVQDNNIDRDLKKRGRGPSGTESGRFTKPERTARGEQHGHSKLTDVQVIEMKSKFLNGERVMDIAKQYGINRSHATQVIKGNKWSHIGMDGCDRNASIKIPDEAIVKIREMYTGGFRQADLCRIFELSSQTVTRIVNNQRRKSLLQIENQ